MSVLEESAESHPLIHYQHERRQSEDSFVRVEIKSIDAVSTAIEKCEKRVLRWYRLLLKLLGWTPIERLHQSVHGLWITFWVMVILLAFVAQILSCFRRDTFFESLDDGNTTVLICKEHVFNAFIITDFPILAAYALGVFLFSKTFKETEYLSKLAEKAFIVNFNANRKGSNQWLVGVLCIFLLSGMVWICLSFGVRMMVVFSSNLFSENVVIQWDDLVLKGPGKIVLILLALVGFFFFDVVYIVAVMNYAAQSEMNVHLLRATTICIEEKIDYTSKDSTLPDAEPQEPIKSKIDTAIKEVLECKEYLHVLNGKTAAITALILFNLGASGVIALITVNSLQGHHELVVHKDLATAAAISNAIFWLGLVSFPFIQAARVTGAGEGLKATGPKLRSRPHQYSKTSQLDLDSYVQFTQAVKLRATMFGIPIYPWTVYAVLVAFAFTMLVLLQTGTYYVTEYF